MALTEAPFRTVFDASFSGASVRRFDTPGTFVNSAVRYAVFKSRKTAAE
ncbi:MAG: hypothetical protein R6X19_11235 [Kiritimatiellia bacterium]